MQTQYQSTQKVLQIPTPLVENLQGQQLGVKVYFTDQNNTEWQQYNPHLFLFIWGKGNNRQTRRRGHRWKHPTNRDGSTHNGKLFYGGQPMDVTGQPIAQVQTEWTLKIAKPYEKQTITFEPREWWRDGNNLTQNLMAYPLSTLFPPASLPTKKTWVHRARGQGHNAAPRSYSIKMAFCIAIENPNYTATNGENQFLLSQMSNAFCIHLVQVRGIDANNEEVTSFSGFDLRMVNTQ